MSIEKELASLFKIHQVTLQIVPPSVEISSPRYLTSQTINKPEHEE